MADSGSNNLGFWSDIKQILREAQHRWLRPAEICEILRDYKKFHISPEPPHKPVSGSVFLFDRKVLRYFRKDGHNWRKKKDGKTVREAHEKLKVGSIDMLHCYYAHGEDNENFQRRSYWMLEQDLMHIVFVHYLEVKGNKTNTSYARNNESSVSNSEDDSSSSSCFHGNYEKIVSANATSSSPISTLTSAYETNESEDILHVSSRFDSYPELPLTDDRHPTRSSPCDSLPCPGNRNVAAMNYAALGHRYENSDGGSVLSGAQTKIDLASWEDVFGHCTSGEIAYKQESGCSLPVQANWQENPIEQSNFQMLDSHSDIGNLMKPHAENDVSPVGTENYSFLLKKPLISGLRTEESLKKVDSFSRWVAKELGEADELHMESNNGISWNIMGAEDYSSMPAELQEDLDALSPSLSQDQLFSIIDFSPNWAYSNLETKVLISGTFLKSEQELANCRWSIMFGELEVPAEVLEDGLLCCHAPRHKPGSVPFYITCSNRLACSEVREFEYRFGPQKIVAEDVSEGTSEIQFRLRFEKLMSLNLVCNTYILENDTEKQNIVNRIFSLMERENHQEAKATSENYTSQTNVAGELFLEKQLKEKFYSWLLHKVTEDCKGPNVFDEGGQGPLHLAAALGYNWALLPIIVSKVSIDFRDVNGWTALHWAAFCGREGTVASLISLGAAPGALTDPSAEHPLGRTPADLASASGHKGISGFLAETSLTKHLSSLTVNDPQDYGTSEVKAIHAVSERVAIPKTEQDVPDALSLKDSLAAVCNATQAAARIHQIFRVQSLQRKQFDEQSYDELVTPEEHAISLVAAKTSRLGQNDGTNNAAALRIQKKFRGWKKRKEFLLIRQKIVKIQAHVRGHQVRKKYKPIVWSVGILEKVILRWRRKGAGLRGFQRDGILKGPSMQGTLQQEDDYDFLKEGRKQTEERLQKALARVKSMTQYPEARAQYRRLLTAAEGLRETTQDASGTIENNLEDAIYPEDELIDVETLLDDDTFMSIAFQ